MRARVPGTLRMALSIWLPKAHAGLIFVEQGRIDPRGQGGAPEQGRTVQRRQHHVAQRARLGTVLGQLQIMLHARRIAARRLSCRPPRPRPARRALTCASASPRSTAGICNSITETAFAVSRKVRPVPGTTWFSPGRGVIGVGVIIVVGEIIAVELQAELVGDRIGGHGVQRHIRRRRSRYDIARAAERIGAGIAAAQPVEAAAQLSIRCRNHRPTTDWPESCATFGIGPGTPAAINPTACGAR